MKSQATKRQKELLSIIYQYIKDTGYPPTFEEMRTALNVSSNQSVIDLLSKLEKQQLIRKNESAARGIAILLLGYDALGKPPLTPFLGLTSAGAPMEAIENAGEWQKIPGDVAKFSENVFLLKIQGDSMINAGINNGDIVLIKEQKEFISGDVVLAQIRDESTIKRFISEDKPPYVYLKPENPKYSNILFTDETTLKGKVVSVLKNDNWKPIK
ncbi:MAG: transcriptional repressor LexA [Candidatus Azambacteria bacterium]|nr:transcriptional repressor LexA [Candidatus Azambacteria bacterium]